MKQPKLEKNLQQWDKISKYSEWMYSMYSDYIGKRVLDIGVGIGNMTQYFVKQTEITLCADIFESQLDIVKERFSDCNVETILLDIEKDDIEHLKSYNLDTIICINVLEHIDDHLKALKNMKNIIVDDGRIIIVVPAISKLYSDFDKHAGHFRRYDKGELRELAKKLEMKVLKNNYFNIMGIIPYKIKSKGKVNVGDTFSSSLNKSNSKFYNFATSIMRPLERVIKIPCGLTDVIILEK